MMITKVVLLLLLSTPVVSMLRKQEKPRQQKGFERAFSDGLPWNEGNLKPPKLTVTNVSATEASSAHFSNKPRLSSG
eukprot:scaffold17996_cov194-Amphora_coffeaeformis.AAC.7